MSAISSTSLPLNNYLIPYADNTPSPSVQKSEEPKAKSLISGDTYSKTKGKGSKVTANTTTVASAGAKPTKTQQWIQQEEAALQANLKKMSIGDQGQKNSCGTTSMSNAFSYFGLPFSNKKDFEIIDQAIRPWNYGAGTATAPGDIVKLARKVGMQAQEYSNASLEDIATHLRAGRTITVITNYCSPRSPSTDKGVHYVNIIGVKRDSKGQISKLIVRNPWGSGYEKEEIPAKDFMEMWTNVRMARTGIQKAVPICNRTMVVVAKPDSAKLPKSASATFDNSNINLTLGGVNGVAAGVNQIKGGNIVSGSGQVLGSSLNTIIGGANYIVGNLIGKNIETGGDALIETGCNMMNGDLIDKAGGVGACILGGILKAGGWTINKGTNGISAVTGSLTNLLTTSGDSKAARSVMRNAINQSKNLTADFAKASSGTKAAMVNLLCKGDAADQAAAVRVLQAAKSNGDLKAVVQQLGGRSAVLKLFTGNSKTTVTNLLNSAKI